MKLTDSVCQKCRRSDYRLKFKGLGFLLLSGIECTSCGHVYKVKTLLKGMSLQYVDILGKFIFLANGVYFILLKYYPGAVLMFLVVLLINYAIYPLMFKLSILQVDFSS